MSELFESRYFSGQGPLFLGSRTAAGAPAGLTFIGDVGAAELTPQVERAEVIENTSGSAGIGSSFIKKAQYSLSITLRSIKPEHLALALHGAVTAKSAASVTNEAVTGYHGKFTPLAHVKVSSVVVTNTAGTTTYTAGTDYVLHADAGMIEILSTGAITDGQSLHVDYSYAAQDHVNTAPANTDRYLMFSGLNRADSDKRVRCEIYKVRLDPGVFGLIQQESAEAQIGGIVLQDALRASGDQFFKWQVER